jgi:spore maturation protein CgeB
VKILFVVGRHAYGDPARGEGYEHANMLPALRALGHEVVLFESFDRTAYPDFAALNIAFVDAVAREAPHVVLLVLQTYELWTETLDLVRAATDVALVNWGTDDSWKYRPFARFVAPHLDCYATTSEEALAAARRDGHENFVLTQWAANDAALAEPLPAARCRHRVSFVGAAYGNRRRWVAGLARHGVAVECFGHGWANGPVSADEVRRIFRESVVSLNFGDSGLQWRGLVPYRSRQIKARVFEVPGAGGMLLTESAPGLDRYYRIGAEIDTFHDAASLASRIRHYLDHPGERDRVARAGHARTRAEHTYGARLDAVLRAACAARERLRPDAPRQPDVAMADARLAQLVAAYRPTAASRLLRAALARPLSLVWGARRGPRAARRLLWELSWRLFGARTYSAAGLPGRLFYEES